MPLPCSEDWQRNVTLKAVRPTVPSLHDDDDSIVSEESLASHIHTHTHTHTRTYGQSRVVYVKIDKVVSVNNGD